MTYEIKLKWINYLTISNILFSLFILLLTLFFRDTYFYHWIHYLPIDGFKGILIILIGVYFIEIIAKYILNTNKTKSIFSFYNILDILIISTCINNLINHSIHQVQFYYFWRIIILFDILKFKELILIKSIFERNVKKLVLALSMFVLLYLAFTLVSQRLVFAYNVEFWFEGNKIRTFTTYILSASQSTKTTVDYWENQIELFRNGRYSEDTIKHFESNLKIFEIELFLLSNITFIISWLIILLTIISIVKTEIEESRNRKLIGESV